MRESDQAFRVELCGIQEKDKNVLKRILAITQGRTRTYTLFDSEIDEDADIVIVNADDPDAKIEWQQKFVSGNGHSIRATLLASRNTLNDPQYSSTKLPFFPSRVLKCLDEVTVKELNYTPEIRIEEPDEVEITKSAPDKFQSELSKQEIETFIGKRPNLEPEYKKRTALVVDDSLPVRKALDMKLRLMDYDVELASSGRDALLFLQKKDFDFIFLDVVMPGIDGYEVCRRIKRNRFTSNIPIIMLTSKSSPFDKVKGKLAGCDTYLTKPVEQDKFEQVVANIFN